MKTNVFDVDDRAVSPVVGVALLIAITVILAAVIGAVVLGLGTGGVDTPQAQMQAQFADINDSTDHDDVDIQHNGGEPLPDDQITVVVETDDSEDTFALSDGAGVEQGEELTAGGNVTYNADQGEFDDDEDIVSAQIIWEDPNSDSETVLEEFEA